METRYYLGHERLRPTGSTNMAGGQKRLFVLMARNAQSAAQIEFSSPLDAKRDWCCAIIGHTVD